MELQKAENSSENTLDILQSLSSSIDIAKDLVDKCQRGTGSCSDYDLKTTVSQLEAVIKSMGECLSLIPSSAFQNNEYAEAAVRSLSNETQNADFELNEGQVLETEVLEPLRVVSREQSMEEPVPEESDLYSIHVEATTDMPQPSEFLIERYFSSQKEDHRRGSSSTSLPQILDFIEPPYETFYCPLTKEIMEDPVTLKSGVTYERKAISHWFEEFGNSQEVVCPVTGKKLLSRILTTNIPLKTTIEKWRERDDREKIKFARAALRLASSASMVLEAVTELQSLCRKKSDSKIQVRNAGILPLLVRFLEYKDRNVRCAVLELFRELAREDGDDKEVVAKALDIPAVIRMLSSGHQPIRHSAMLLLLDLSKSQYLCEKIGSVTGAIMMLIRMKYNKSDDEFLAEKADETLQNLERSPENIKHMAENGLIEPLLRHLIQGSEDAQMEMASFLGEIAIGDDNQSYVAERASPTLINMVHSGNTLIRASAFKALSHISSYQPNAKILIKAGIIIVMIEEMFTRRICNEPMDSKTEAAAILANILEAGVQLENLQVDTRGLKLTSDYFLSNIIYMLNSQAPNDLNLSLIRILLCLTKSSKSMDSVVSAIRETEANFTLIELINKPPEELEVATIRLLTRLSHFMGHTLIDGLCKTAGQPDRLIQSVCGSGQVTEKKAVSATFLAKVPHQNLTLNLALLSKNAVPVILEKISQIQKTGTRTSRYASLYLEGLVGILVRFTTTLDEPQMLFLARNYNLTSVFTELLLKTSSNEVQRLSAIGLANLSLQSVTLSKPPPQVERTKFLSRFPSRKKSVPVCPVHGGACSSQNTFCLVEAKAVKRLLACFDNEKVEVVESALSAISTLLDDKVDVDKSIAMLSEVNAIAHILGVVKRHREEGLWQKSFWIIERFLSRGGNKCTSHISQDKLLPATLVSAFHHGSGDTRQLAEKILSHLDKMSNSPTTYNHTL
ncbi:hypothetical protein Tsubulata_048758 [Turnera subulata]|uniref:RING-type E3 ubiquitin transferase n=1 Tax=Turnera subulata TaxID=218843 RepID=A0A9Q0F537_9ROSI|nr:hypothetical protein Tsubulata_048758 [Turnera subulata]